jgi:hypothetical protein
VLPDVLVVAVNLDAVEPARVLDQDGLDLGHEFRPFTGLTPTRYVQVRRQFLREYPGQALDGWPLPAD